MALNPSLLSDPGQVTSLAAAGYGTESGALPNPAHTPAHPLGAKDVKRQVQSVENATDLRLVAWLPLKGEEPLPA